MGAKRSKTPKELTKPVFLIGFMGAGKSSVARRLARMCGIASVDLDSFIERREGKKISEIFADIGESGFREIETQALQELASGDYPMLISCGGGIVVTPQNIDIMRDHGCVIHLEVDVDEAASRISDKSTRPLFNDLESARQRLEDRLPAYESASHHKISTMGKNVYQIAIETMNLLEKEGILCQQRR